MPTLSVCLATPRDATLAQAPVLPVLPVYPAHFFPTMNVLDSALNNITATLVSESAKNVQLIALLAELLLKIALLVSPECF